MRVCYFKYFYICCYTVYRASTLFEVLLSVVEEEVWWKRKCGGRGKCGGRASVVEEEV